jgi:hypothetical protein
MRFCMQYAVYALAVVMDCRSSAELLVVTCASWLLPSDNKLYDIGMRISSLP